MDLSKKKLYTKRIGMPASPKNQLQPNAPAMCARLHFALHGPILSNLLMHMNVSSSKNSTRLVPSFLVHIHPRRVPLETLRFTLSFGLGGMSATLIVLLFASGILQLLSYTPEISLAYDSVSSMYGAGNLSGWTRNIHYFSGNLLVILATLHCIRVFLTGAISGPRRRNWFIGLLLLGCVFFANFSGYLLPWDQLAFWAVTIFTNMVCYVPLVGETLVQMLREGGEIGPTTLTTFYAIHTAWLPLFLVSFLIYHFWLIRKNGGLIRGETSIKSPPVTVPAVPHLVVREGAVGLGLIAVILVLAALIDAHASSSHLCNLCHADPRPLLPCPHPISKKRMSSRRTVVWLQAGGKTCFWNIVSQRGYDLWHRPDR